MYQDYAAATGAVMAGTLLFSALAAQVSSLFLAAQVLGLFRCRAKNNRIERFGGLSPKSQDQNLV